jgi:hypothetical protein
VKVPVVVPVAVVGLVRAAEPEKTGANAQAFSQRFRGAVDANSARPVEVN